MGAWADLSTTAFTEGIAHSKSSAVDPNAITYADSAKPIPVHRYASIIGRNYVWSFPMVMTPAKPADRTQMDALVVEEIDAINVFDRGYVDYKQFDRYCNDQIPFVTRLKENAIMEVMAELNVNPESAIKRDAIVFLGKNNRRMKHPLRLFETEDTKA